MPYHAGRLVNTGLCAFALPLFSFARLHHGMACMLCMHAVPCLPCLHAGIFVLNKLSAHCCRARTRHTLHAHTRRALPMHCMYVYAWHGFGWRGVGFTFWTGSVYHDRRHVTLGQDLSLSIPYSLNLPYLPNLEQSSLSTISVSPSLPLKFHYLPTPLYPTTLLSSCHRPATCLSATHTACITFKHTPPLRMARTRIFPTDATRAAWRKAGAAHAHARARARFPRARARRARRAFLHTRTPLPPPRTTRALPSARADGLGFAAPCAVPPPPAPFAARMPLLSPLARVSTSLLYSARLGV